jgi:serine/threonine-protein kinase
MALQPGTTLGPYEVTAKIGEGGMGEVYRARDTKLDRDVALKVLPQAFTDDPDRLARFEREAKVLASLNHPNIGGIHGLEESDGVRALVLEYIEGPTLADRIAQGPIPIDEALPIARQIAEALEAAHEAGVIHRDLKPANIKVRDDGTVKVLDFGLAKALDTTPEGDPSLSPTLTAAATQMGVIMGTAAYMSPEQARGKPVDKRADIWAFGAVLFEMLTGKRAFEGEDVSVTLANVINQPPDWEALPNSLSPVLATYLRRCLTKGPKQRIPDIAAIRLAMEGAFETAVEVASDVAVVPTLRFWQRPVWVGVFVLLAAAVSGFAAWTVSSSPSAVIAPPNRLTASLAEADRYTNQGLTLSPDGRELVYAGTRGDESGLFRRPIGQFEAVLIPGTEGASGPFFSPDGEWVGFVAGGELKKVAIAGGPVQVLAESATGGGSWGEDDQIFFSGGSLSQVSAAGGVAQRITTVGRAEGEFVHLSPQVLPRSKGLLFQVYRGMLGSPQVAVLSFENDEWWNLFEGTQPRYVKTGHIVFVRDDALWAVPFNLEELEVAGEPVPLGQIVPGAEFRPPQFAVGEEGTLVYAPASRETGRSVVWVTRDGGEESVPGLDPGDYVSLRLSPDGTQIALDETEADGRTNIWVYDTVRATRNQITSSPASEIVPLWTPDAEQIVFGSNREGTWGLHITNSDGTGTVERLTSDEEVELGLGPEDWSPDGQVLLYIVDHAGPGFDIGLLPQDGTATAGVIAESWFPRVSPDGRWLAYSSARAGQEEVYVERFPDLGDRQVVSSGGGHQPEWSPDGSTLFYLTLDGTRLMSVSIDPDTALPTSPAEVAAEGEFLVSGGFATYDIAPDGQRFLMMKPQAQGTQTRINVVQNWLQELTERVRVN